jgi:FPC/CPF motif-containing protein YcgG
MKEKNMYIKEEKVWWENEEKKKNKSEEKIYNKAPRFSSCIWKFQKDFKIKTHTHLSNHVQSDNKDFVCASGSLFAICTCPTI